MKTDFAHLPAGKLAACFGAMAVSAAALTIYTAPSAKAAPASAPYGLSIEVDNPGAECRRLEAHYKRFGAPAGQVAREDTFYNGKTGARCKVKSPVR